MTAPGAIRPARQVLERAIGERVFPAATVDVGSSTGSLWTDAFGTLSFEPNSQPAGVETIFDLASLTKVVATTSVLMDLVRTARVRLDDRVSTVFEEWRGVDRETVTVRDLLEHASGLSARLVDPPPNTRREFEHEICRMPLEYVPRTQSVYSDLDFVLLGFLASDKGGASLAELFDRIAARLKPDMTYPKTDDAYAVRPDVISALGRTPKDVLAFDLTPGQKRAAAPTLPLAEDPRRGRTLAGEVHDNYAAALGGVAGHAGLFGTASAVGRFARVVLRAVVEERGSQPPPFSRELLSEFTKKTTVPGSSRALGWDTMLPTSSCGTRMSARAFGHVGFTGTSLWIDPDRDRYFVLLTNRACGGGSLDDMRAVRCAFHDALGDL